MVAPPAHDATARPISISTADAAAISTVPPDCRELVLTNPLAPVPVLADGAAANGCASGGAPPSLAARRTGIAGLLVGLPTALWTG